MSGLVTDVERDQLIHAAVVSRSSTARRASDRRRLTFLLDRPSRRPCSIVSASAPVVRRRDIHLRRKNLWETARWEARKSDTRPERARSRSRWTIADELDGG